MTKMSVLHSSAMSEVVAQNVGMGIRVPVGTGVSLGVIPWMSVGMCK